MTLPALFALIQEAANTAAQAPATQAAGDQQAAAGGSSPLMMNLLMMGAIAAIFYFVLIGPERKNRKKREEMLSKLGKHQKVMTSSGIYGSVASVGDDNTVMLQIDDNVRIKISRSAIQEVFAESSGESSKK